MNRAGEAILAFAVLLAIGTGLWLFSGGPGDDGAATLPAPSVDEEAATRGAALAAETGCLVCHSIDGTPGTGPTWKGLAGSTRPLETGESVVADATYLFNSIVDPKAQIVQGFADVMPDTYRDQLTEQAINDLVAYIQSLGS